MNTRTIADGIVTKTEKGLDEIRFERRLEHPIEAVWAALTEPDQLVKWWGEAEVDPAVDGRFNLRWLNTDPDGNAVQLDARIATLERPRLLELVGDWASFSPEGERIDGKATKLRWELEADGEQTLLRFANVVELTDEERANVPGGWHYHLDALATALDGSMVDLADPWEAAERLHSAYRAKLGSAG
jgi:uncharacterized protein YndB with AHSA1/START domain